MVQARRSGAATAVAADTTVALTETATGTARYYSDAACSLSITTTTILAGQTNAGFYLKPLTGGTTTQTATAPFGTANRTLNIVGAVRRNFGSCSLAGPQTLSDGGTQQDYTESCTINPPHQSLSRTALFFQASASSGTAGTAMIRCRLTAVDTVFCSRADATGYVNIHWQTIELPLGFRVERAPGACQANPPFTVSLPAAVNPASTFLLASYSVGSGDIDDDDLITTRLMSSTTIEVDRGTSSTPCDSANFDIQALEMAGVSVTRGSEDAGMAIGVAAKTISGLSATSLNTAMLSQQTVPNHNDPVCNVMVRSEMPTPSSISFTRGSGVTGACVLQPVYKIAWERIDFGSRARVQTRTVTVPVGTTTLAVPISAVDTTRTVVFAGSQAGAGQSTGETSYSGTASYLGEGNARFELSSPTNVNVIRVRNGGIGTFTFYVVEFDP